METRSRAKSLNVECRNESDSVSSDEDDDDEDEIVQEEKVGRGNRHFSMDADCKLSGKDVYAFKTPKRKSQMTEKASHSASSHKTSVADSITVTRHGSRSIRKKASSVVDADSTSHQTPHSVRRRIKKRLVKMVIDESDVEDESSGSNSSDTDDEGASRSDATKRSPPGRRGRRPLVDGKSPASSLKQIADAEDYFAAHNNKSKTSDNTLSRLRIPRLDQQTLENILKQHSQSHERCCKKMFEVHRRHFPKWIFQMSHGFNLLLYGLGSKMSILEELREWLLSTTTSAVLVINGFFPAVTIKNILNSITEDVLEHAGDFARAEDQVNFIAKTLSKSDGVTGDGNAELYVFINNIDGATLKNEKAQSVLCSLAQVQCVHVVATIDHINAPLLWDQARLSGFNWVWYDATTYLPYVSETSYENSLLVQQSGTLVLTSVNHVFQSLTPNAKGIFLLIADYQLAHKEQTNFIGMAFQECYQKCREAFLVNSELTLKAQLTEFKDHKLIRERKGIDGGEYLHILLDTATLEEFRKQQDDCGS